LTPATPATAASGLRHRRLGHRLVWALAAWVVSSPVLATQATHLEAPRIDIDQTSPAQAPEGHLLVSWTVQGPDKGWFFILEQAAAADFSDAVPHRVGQARSRFVTGLPAGPTWVRVGARTADASHEAPWSEPLLVEVAYPSMATVWPLMALGLAMLLATALLIHLGHLHTRRETSRG
jgi:hypothetical protein